MKVKKSELKRIYATLDEMSGFLSCSIDFVDDDQLEYIRKMRNNIDRSQDIIKGMINDDRK